MYGLSDQANGIPRTRLRALRQGSSRYSARTLRRIANICSFRAGRRRPRPYTAAGELDEKPPSTYALEVRA
jgi:hypothetical protein